MPRQRRWFPTFKQARGLTFVVPRPISLHLEGPRRKRTYKINANNQLRLASTGTFDLGSRAASIRLRGHWCATWRTRRRVPRRSATVAGRRWTTGLHLHRGRRARRVAGDCGCVCAGVDRRRAADHLRGWSPVLAGVQRARAADHSGRRWSSCGEACRRDDSLRSSGRWIRRDVAGWARAGSWMLVHWGWEVAVLRRRRRRRRRSRCRCRRPCRCRGHRRSYRQWSRVRLGRSVGRESRSSGGSWGRLRYLRTERGRS